MSVAELSDLPEHVLATVSRKAMFKDDFGFEVTESKCNDKGWTIVSSIKASGAAAMSCQVQLGDIVIQVGDRLCFGKLYDRVNRLLREAPRPVQLRFLHPSHVPLYEKLSVLAQKKKERADAKVIEDAKRRRKKARKGSKKPPPPPKNSDGADLLSDLLSASQISSSTTSTTLANDDIFGDSKNSTFEKSIVVVEGDKDEAWDPFGTSADVTGSSPSAILQSAVEIAEEEEVDMFGLFS